MADPWFSSNAVVSPCGVYRYFLQRIWDARRLPLVWIMLNPSTADAEVDDPTIRRCMGFARRENAGGIEVLNLFALRSTDPRALKSADDPIGAGNDEWYRETLHSGDTAIAAWGRHGSLRGRDAAVIRMLRERGVQLIGLDGVPKHPLYVRGTAPFLEIKTGSADD